MPPENAKPAGPTAGGVEGPGQDQPTGGSYPGALANTITDEQWEAAVMAVFNLAGGDSEREVRARRAIHALLDQPFISRPVWTAAESVAWIFVAAIMSGDEDLRVRANALTKSVLTLAAEARESLGRAA